MVVLPGTGAKEFPISPVPGPLRAAEAYYSPDGKSALIFSSSRSAAPGERSLSLFIMDISSPMEQRIFLYS